MAGNAGAATAAIGSGMERVGTGRIVLASLVGTTIEFYDFYIYGTAAALVIGQTFFPQSAAGSQALNAFLTFGIAFLARPIGSILFGHFGDRVGRKSTLVASMLVMGLSTTLIGVLPGYEQAGALAPWLLCILRFGQGIGLGGEWGGAALLATENAPRGRRAWFGMFPQLGPPLGFLMANGLFLLLLLGLGEASFVAWGWRIPFLISAALADRLGRRPVLLTASVLAALSGFSLPVLLGGSTADVLVFLSLALGIMGLAFAPLGALLPELFPTRVRYTGASSAYNLGGILGASLAPSLAQLLLERGGLAWVGYYVTAAAAISFLSILSMKETGGA
jgi:MFS family permease